jgi:hypothetical protein
VPSAGSTGWCLVESPDDESPSGPRNEEGHGPLDAVCLSRFSVMADGRSGGCAALEEESPRENLGWLPLGEDRLARA